MNWENVFEAARACLAAANVDEKLALTQAAARAWREGRLGVASDDEPAPFADPGRPDKPELVTPSRVSKRGLGTPEGRAALLHALSHIEFNAINLAWDAVYRFRGMPAEFYGDWIQVADEEAYHFALLTERLAELGHRYGDFPAHDGLWDMAGKTAHDVMVRMALVPRVMEARGLDVTPAIMKRLAAVGESRAVGILEIILRDEIGHVRTGSLWFRHECEARGLDVESTFRDLITQYFAGQLRGPFYHDARMKAGFSEEELRALESLSSAS